MVSKKSLNNRQRIDGHPKITIVDGMILFIMSVF
jgi:hypothetical protein